MKIKKSPVKKIIKSPVIPKEKEFIYSVDLETSGEVFNFKGDSLFEIFNKLSPAIVKGKSILKVEKGGLKTEIVLYQFQLKRLMLSKVFKQIFEKRLNNRLK